LDLQASHGFFTKDPNALLVETVSDNFVSRNETILTTRNCLFEWEHSSWKWVFQRIFKSRVSLFNNSSNKYSAESESGIATMVVAIGVKARTENRPEKPGYERS